MNVIFAKTALYAYTNLEAVADQIDELVEKKALSSISDYSPAIEQCHKMQIIIQRIFSQNMRQ